MRDKLIGWGIPEKRIFYLPNGVDAERFSPPDPGQVDQLRKELRLGGNKVIGYIGSLSLPSHPVNLLIEAFQKVHESEERTILMLVGGGEDIDSLKNLSGQLGIADATRFCGRIPPGEVSLYYSASDVTVDPVYDNDAARGRSPLKIFESWAMGTPLITGDVGDRQNLLGKPPAGLLIQPGDRDAIEGAILRLIRDPNLITSLSSLGFDRVKIYSWDKLSRELETVYLS
jgi:glycosyltransferase involved in cell wall biosynthesis